MLGKADISHAHEKLDGMLNLQNATIVRNEAMDNMAAVAESYGVSFDAIREIAEDYSTGVVYTLPMVVEACDGDPIATFQAVGMSAFVQGFMVALSTVYEAGGNNAA